VDVGTDGLAVKVRQSALLAPIKGLLHPLTAPVSMCCLQREALNLMRVGDCLKCSPVFRFDININALTVGID
jgi:hypothetical protein